MAILLFANNASSTLQSPIGPSTTSVNLAPGAGASFPNPGANQYFLATLTDAATGLLKEIVRCTAVSGDTVTIARAQEGTTARSWNAGDHFDNLWTAGSAAQMLQQGQMPQSNNYAPDTGAVNALVITLTPAPGSLATLLGTPLYVKVANTNTSTTPTLNVNGLGPQTIVTISSSGVGTVPVGAIPVGEIIPFVWDGTHFQFQGTTSANAPTVGNLYGVDSGGVNALAITVSPVPASLAALAGQVINVHVNNTTTSGTPTLNVNGLGPVLIGGWGGQQVSPGAISSGDIAQFAYNTGGGYFEYMGSNLVGSNSHVGIGASGYIKFPNGTLMQWGTLFSATGHGDVITFPIAFTTAYSIMTNAGISGSPNTEPNIINAYPAGSLLAFVLWTYVWNGSAWAPQSGIGVDWLAIGY